jgi:hypothetical protein
MEINWQFSPGENCQPDGIYCHQTVFPPPIFSALLLPGTGDNIRKLQTDDQYRVLMCFTDDEIWKFYFV